MAGIHDGDNSTLLATSSDWDDTGCSSFCFAKEASCVIVETNSQP